VRPDISDQDEQLELKKRARRRLVGAIVFVTVAAVVLPMVMDNAPPPIGGIALHIPKQEKGYTPLVSAPATSLERPVMTVAPPEPVVVPPAPPAAPVLQATPAATTKPAAASATGQAKAGSVPASEALRVASILSDKAEGAAPGLPAKAASGPHVVLIGAYANPANVQQLQKKLGAMGIKVYTELLDSPQGRKTRLRAGPFPNRDEAEKARARMKKAGISGVVAAKS